MGPYDFDLILQSGQPPFTGKVLEQLMGLEYRFREHVTFPNQVFALVEGQWWRMMSDGPTLYIQRWDQAPEACEIPEEDMFWRLRDLGEELFLLGETLTGWSYGERNHAPSLSLNFQNGRQVTFLSTDGDSWSSLEVTQWEISHLK